MIIIEEAQQPSKPIDPQVWEELKKKFTAMGCSPITIDLPAHPPAELQHRVIDNNYDILQHFARPLQ